MDEGRELAKSEEFMKLIHAVLKMVVHTTCGDTSNLYIKAEALPKMTKKTTHALLMTTSMSDRCWCFAIQYAVFSHYQHSSLRHQMSSNSTLLYHQTSSISIQSTHLGF